MGIVLFIVLVLLIIISSALISGSEAAILSISYTKAKEILSGSSDKNKKKAEKLLLIKDNLQNYITTIVVLNNLVNIVGSIYIGVLASNIFGDIYLGLVSAVLTFFIIMFSEIIPKVYGELHSEKISLFISPILIFLTNIFTPIIWILNKISSFFIKSKVSNSVSEGEIREMALLGEKEGSINTYESDVINNVFKMDDIEVYDIMVPKNEIDSLDENASYEDLIILSQKTGFTRFPITKDGEVIGIINVKDLFKYYGREDKFSISKILRPIFYIPENMKIFDLEQKFKKEKTHMAAIVNEHGDLTGIVTLEDIIEELIGDIEDEFDKEEKSLIKKVDENKYIVLANIDFSDLIEELNLNIKRDENDDYTTLNGFLMDKLGKIPRVNNKVKINDISFRVIKASKKKSIEIEIKILN